MNKGFNLKKERLEQSDQDWVFGDVSQPCITDIIEADRLTYLPKGELQYGIEDFMDCATRAPLNILETKFNWLYKTGKLTKENENWLRSKGYITPEGNIEFSDRFIAILSGTTREGNSLKAPLRAIENNGLIPKSLLPASPSMNFDEYHDKTKITDYLVSLGKEFKERFPINYEKVYEVNYKELLREDMIGAAGYAWPQPIDGEYPKSNKAPNHTFVIFRTPAYFVFDNYYDVVDGDFIKKLTPDYDFIEYGYRVFISAQNNITERNSKIMQILRLIGEALGLIKKQVELPILPTNDPTMPTPKYQWDTNENVRLSIRKIADEEGLTPLQKDLACDIAYCESGYNPKAKLVNNPKSIDRGLFQWNSYWHPQITDEIAYDPEKNARLGCKAIKEGKTKTYWSASMKCWNRNNKYISIV